VTRCWEGWTTKALHDATTRQRNRARSLFMMMMMMI
jgi:hypothetical protein